ncbi:MAG: phosphomannomutase/phosphoglucomutase [archaeon]|nr:phosphomannomutase/phosphoglucomutase [Candidatus Micrarchaeota archaeon]
MKVNPLIFREYDIRGKVGIDLNEEAMELIGKAIGTFFQQKKSLLSFGKKTLIIGRDNRTSSESFSKALIKGITSTGINVIDLGLTPTPLNYYAVVKLNASGGVMLTASHNPSEYNGLKLSASKGAAIAGEKIQEIRKILEANSFSKGEGKTEEKNITEDYFKELVKKFDLPKKLRIVVDAGNGLAGLIAPKAFRKLGCEVVELYTELDGTFPNHLPDPTVDENVVDLISWVKAEHADLGIAFDGDCDRLGVVSEKGERIEADKLLLFFARDFLKKKPNSRILFDVKCSQALIDDIKSHKGIPVMDKTGHTNIKEKMRKEKILVGGEMSGHIYFADDWHGFDDGFYAACRFLSILSHSSFPLSEMLSTIPLYYSSPEIRVYCGDKEKFKIVEELVKEFKQKFKVIDIDGARVLFKDGWGLVRASNTQPALVLRFEAKNPEALEEIKKVFRKTLEKFKSVRAGF